MKISIGSGSNEVLLDAVKREIGIMIPEHETIQAEPTVVDRRTLLGRSAMVIGGLAAGQLMSVEKALAAVTAPREKAEEDTFTMAIAGESMVYRSFSKIDDPKFLTLIKTLRDADLAKDLAWAGIDCMSLAQNHSLDWGPDGLLATIKHCREAGIAVAGTGPDLETARSPTFLESPKGRMALISIASGNSAFEWAGLSKGDIPGRPGVNPVRLRGPKGCGEAAQ